MNKKNKNNKILDMLPNIKNLKFSNFLSLKKWKSIKTNKIINIYTVGVCIDKKAKKQMWGNKNHKNLFFPLIAIKRLKIANSEKM